MIYLFLLNFANANSSISIDEGVLDLKKDIYLYSRDISISVMHHNNANLKNYKGAKYIVDKFIEYSVKYNDDYGINKDGISDCASDSLNIIYVSEDYLNDPFRLKVLFGENYNTKFEGRKLIGLYDYRFYESHIYITDSRYENNGISFEERLAHEISHFWYKKSCSNPNDPENEKRALEFEKVEKKWVKN